MKVVVECLQPIVVGTKIEYNYRIAAPSEFGTDWMKAELTHAQVMIAGADPIDMFETEARAKLRAGYREAGYVGELTFQFVEVSR